MKDGALGIGAVSRLTGIPAPTLRTWEMRYGRPVPERGPGGQRLYAPDVVHWLKLVQAVTSRGVQAASKSFASLSASKSSESDIVPQSSPTPRSAPAHRVNCARNPASWRAIAARQSAAECGGGGTPAARPSAG